MVETAGKSRDASRDLEPRESRDGAFDRKGQRVENDVEVERLVPRQKELDEETLLGIERRERRVPREAARQPCGTGEAFYRSSV